MGGWTFVEARLVEVLPDGRRPRFIGRAASASPATGFYTTHELEQTDIVQNALGLRDEPGEIATETVPKMGLGG